jgi:hypothetical protein
LDLLLVTKSGSLPYPVLVIIVADPAHFDTVPDPVNLYGSRSGSATRLLRDSDHAAHFHDFLNHKLESMVSELQVQFSSYDAEASFFTSL